MEDQYITYTGTVKSVLALTEGYGENQRTVGVTVEAEVSIPDPEDQDKFLQRTCRIQLPLEAKPFPNVTGEVEIRFDW